MLSKDMLSQSSLRVKGFRAFRKGALKGFSVAYDTSSTCNSWHLSVQRGYEIKCEEDGIYYRGKHSWYYKLSIILP